MPSGSNSAGKEAQDRPRQVCLGIIVGPHGIHGEVRIRSFTAVPQDIGAYGHLENEAGNCCFFLTVTGHHNGTVRARLEGIDNRNDAEALRGTKLFAIRGALPAEQVDEYYYHDLINLLVEKDSGEPLGRVTATHNFGGGDLIAVTLDNSSQEILLPFTKELVQEVDIAAGRLVVGDIEGFIEEERKTSRRRKRVPLRTVGRRGF